MFRALILVALLLMAGCDPSRVYETNHDFDKGEWIASDTVIFNFNIPDSTQRYNLILNVRNTIDFNTARVFVQYQLSDSINTLRKRLIEENLFDRKTGAPFGESGLGDLYTHQFLLEPGITFSHPGSHQVKLNQMMRYDTLPEIRSVGIRIEKSIQ